MLGLKDKLNLIGEKLEGRVLVETDAMGTLSVERGIDINHHHGNLTYAKVEKPEQKVEVGAPVFRTQPVFDIEPLETALEKIEGMDLKISLKLRPLTNHRQAKVLHHEITGVDTRSTSGKLCELGDEYAPKYVVEVAQNLLAEAKPLAAGPISCPQLQCPSGRGHLRTDYLMTVS